MRLFTLHAFAATLAVLAASPAEATMFKCTSRDGTVLYQARPCGAGEREVPVASVNGQDGAPSDAASRSASPREAQERAVAERDLAQRRARCGTSRESIDRLSKLLGSPNEVQRHQAANEIKAQEKRMKDDACASI